MAKLIHKKNHKKQELVKKRLRETRVSISLPYPKDMSALDALEVGQQFLHLGKLPEAEIVADVLIGSCPPVIDIFLLKLSVLIQLEKVADAQELLTELEQQAPRNLGVLQHTARLNMLLGDAPRAASALKQALALRPDSLDLQQIYAEYLEQTGSAEKAAEIYTRIADKAIARNNVTVAEQSLFQLSALQGLSESQERAAELFLAAQGDEVFSFGFCLAHSARKKKDYETESHWLKIANQKMAQFEGSQNKGWDLDKIKQRNEILKQYFPAAAPDWLQRIQSEREERPILIVAMPRSGTTLLEQILGSHAELGQTGESRSLNNAVDQVYIEKHGAYTGFPDCLDQFEAGEICDIADRYINSERAFTSKPVFINKNLSNHLYLGLVKTLFPKAKFIYLKRDALDNALSIFQHRIFNASYSTNLEYIIQAQQQLDSLMQHWRQVLPNSVFTLEYETLVSDGETALKPLLEFLEIEWSPSLLEFSKRKNLVRTPSVNQVRKGLNTSAINKRQHYDKLLADARQALQNSP